MTVKETIAFAAESLGVSEQVNDYFEHEGENGKAETESLLQCFNRVENELALDYLPLYAEEVADTSTGRIDYASLSKAAVRIVRVTDENGDLVKYQLFSAYLKAEKPGKLTVTYTYAPAAKTLNDSSDFTLRASVRLIAYGMAAEYCLCKGLFEEAAVWDRKYKDGIEAAYRARPSKTMRLRRWA